MESMTPAEWLVKMRKAAAGVAEVERRGIREGANAVSFLRHSPVSTPVQAVGNRMRVSGSVNVPRVTSAIVNGVDAAIEEAWR